MTGNRLLWHTIFVYSLPVLAWWLGGGWWLAISLVLLALVSRWLIVMTAVGAPANVPPVQLDSIAASHFVEKVRWCLDRLGVAYVERPAAATLGAFTLGRSVPRLRVATGRVVSSIGNSPEILRYLYGQYLGTSPAAARFLEPTPSRLALEREIDAIGVLQQRWVYFHILDHRDLALKAWGHSDPRTPAWQQPLLPVLYPVLRALVRRAFRISPASHVQTVERMERALDAFEQRLGERAGYLDGGSEPDFTDIAFAAINSLWLQPAGFGGGAADGVRLATENLPQGMLEEITRWRQQYPAVVAHVERLYREERQADV